MVGPIPSQLNGDSLSHIHWSQIDVAEELILILQEASNCGGAGNAPMSELRGRWFDFRGTKLAVTYHPAFLLRDPRQKKETWKDLQMVMKDLGLAVPAKADP